MSEQIQDQFLQDKLRPTQADEARTVALGSIGLGDVAPQRHPVDATDTVIGATPVVSRANKRVYDFGRCSGKEPLLTREEKQLHGKNIQDGIRLRELLAANDGDKTKVADLEGATVAFLEDSLLRADSSRQTMIERNMGLVYKVAQKFAEKRRVEIEDLVQEGVFGLMRAVELFDPYKEFEFSTYAGKWIESKIRKALDEKFDVIKKTSLIIGDIMTIARAENGVKLSDDALTEASGLSLKRIRGAKNAQRTRSVGSLDAARSPDGTASLGDSIPDSSSSEGFDVVELGLLMASLERLFDDAELTPREREILKLRHIESLTLEKIGEIYDLTSERIRQVEAKALIKLRKRIKKPGTEEWL